MNSLESAGCPVQSAARVSAARRTPSRAGTLRFAVLATGLALAAPCLASAATDLSAETNPAVWPETRSGAKREEAIETRVRQLLTQMSLEEKVGQIIQADIASIQPEDLQRYPLGSILAGGNSAPGGKAYATAQEWLALADAFHAANASRRGTVIPLLFGIDAVHGHNNVIGATLFPHNIGLGAARDPELVQRIAEITARELRVTGAEWTFAPTLTVPRDDRWGRAYEGFSEDPAVVASYAAAVVHGLQGEPGTPGFLGEDKVLSSAKHFVGDGGTTDGRDQGDTRVSEAELRDVHAAGYPPAIAAGVQSVMASFSSWNGIKLHGHRGLLTDVLRGRMGFDGFVVGDWNGHGQIPGCTPTDCPASIEAGVDMFMAPDSWRQLFDNTLKAARTKRLSPERLDEAVSRILRVKLAAGLMDAPPPSKRALGGRFELIGADGHRLVAREAVRRSLVLLKNEGQLLPLNPRARIGVAGDGADSVAKQSGGWTLTWQGTGTQPSDFPGATSIWQGLRTQIEAAGGSAELAVDGRFETRPDIAVVVFGEDPYAEFQGDIDTLVYRPDDERDLQLLRRLRGDNIPVVAVFLSGRPLWVNRELNAANAFVAAWLPGSEGGGVADVLLRAADGSIQHDFHGRLPFSWPARPDQYQLNVGDDGYAPLFAFGHGLRYGEPGEVPPLPEQIDLPAAPRAGQWFARGSLAPGAHFELVDADGVQRIEGNGPAHSPAGQLGIRAVDYQAQEDARRLQWSGPAELKLSLAEAIDIERETNGDVRLVVRLRVDALGEGSIRLGMGCGDDCGAALEVGSALGARLGAWQRLALPLKCLRSAGLATQRVDTVLRLSADRGTDLRIASVELGTDADAVVECSSPR
ncbi:exo-1,4-beta-glucosidase [Aquimonas voraii]|uniref:Exo-1,4-beta-glucosidase n=2 Tax=Aquimonas voraii TaxID=265719 RepID=A0A1G6UP59_9GAMM|nr:exo-1,4-beta-glucosidase [Aquimonas voraii]